MSTARHRNKIVADGGRQTVLATPLNEAPGPLAYSGADAVFCPECGVGLEPVSDVRSQGTIRRHARFGWSASPSRGKPLCRGALVKRPALASKATFPVITEDEARADRLVSRPMIARRYGRGLRQMSQLIRDQPGFPRPVARLDGTELYLYEAGAVASFMSHLEGR